jgi:hypothetical protein
MLTSLMTGRGIMRFELIGKDERVDGLTVPTRINGLGASDIVIGFAGYPTPSLAGLGGAYAVAHGNSWGKYSALMISAGRLLPVGRMASGVMVGQGRQAGAGSAGIQGRPVSASRSAVILSRPCLAAVET